MNHTYGATVATVAYYCQRAAVAILRHDTEHYAMDPYAVDRVCAIPTTDHDGATDHAALLYALAAGAYAIDHPAAAFAPQRERAAARRPHTAPHCQPDEWRAVWESIEAAQPAPDPYAGSIPATTTRKRSNRGTTVTTVVRHGIPRVGGASAIRDRGTTRADVERSPIVVRGVPLPTMHPAYILRAAVRTLPIGPNGLANGYDVQRLADVVLGAPIGADGPDGRVWESTLNTDRATAASVRGAHTDSLATRGGERWGQTERTARIAPRVRLARPGKVRRGEHIEQTVEHAPTMMHRDARGVLHRVPATRTDGRTSYRVTMVPTVDTRRGVFVIGHGRWQPREETVREERERKARPTVGTVTVGPDDAAVDRVKYAAGAINRGERVRVVGSGWSATITRGKSDRRSTYSARVHIGNGPAVKVSGARTPAAVTAAIMRAL